MFKIDVPIPLFYIGLQAENFIFVVKSPSFLQTVQLLSFMNKNMKIQDIKNQSVNINKAAQNQRRI